VAALCDDRARVDARRRMDRASVSSSTTIAGERALSAMMCVRGRRFDDASTTIDVCVCETTRVCD
jgi:hypothetical protein